MPERRLPPLNALRAFEAAARHGSFRDAAHELSVTPAAISHQVKGLEDQLGVTLFRRLNREVRLTDAGRAMLPGLREGFDRIAAAVAAARPDVRGGLLTVSAAPSLAGKWLLPRLDRFRDAHPDIDIRIDASIGLTNFTRDDVDVAIRYGAGRYPGLHVELLMRTEIFPVCAPELTRGARPLRTPADLAHAVLIHEDSPAPDPRCPDWSMWLRAAGVTGVDGTRGLRFGPPLTLDAVLAGRGVTLARSVLVADDLAAGRLVRPFGDAIAADFAYYLVCPPSLMDLPKVAAFRQWVLAEARIAPAPPREAAPPPPPAPAPDTSFVPGRIARREKKNSWS